MRSAVAILTYKRRDQVKAFLDSVLTHCPGVPVAVFEDCGSDGTVEALADGAAPVSLNREFDADHYKTDKFDLFAGRRNLGVTAQSNRALRWFEQSGAEHLCLCNDDLVATGDFVREYACAHAATENHLFTFCDFESDPYKALTVPFRGFEVRLQPRMTGMMMSLTSHLFKRIGYFDQMWSSAFGEEHSLVAGTKILTGDFLWKPIESIKTGDTVIGWSKNRPHSTRYASLYSNRKPHHAKTCLETTPVLKTHSYKSKTVVLTFESGRKVTCTPDHLWFCGSAIGYSAPKVGLPVRRVFDSCPSETEFSSEYAKGYVHGAIDGDGCVSQYSLVLRVTNHDFMGRFIDMAGLLGVKKEPAVKQYPVVTTGGIKTGEMRSMLQVSLPRIKIGQPSESRDFYLGWLAGLYDAEGHGGSIAQSIEAKPEMSAKIVRALALFGFKTKVCPKQINIQGGRNEVLRFYSLVKPACSYKLRTKILQSFSSQIDKIVSIEDGPTQTVYCLTTGSENYIADGYASHNCSWNNRAYFTGLVHINGQAQRSLDIVSRHLKSVNVPSTIPAEQRPELDKLASESIKIAAEEYDWYDHYRPFGLVWPRVVGGAAGVSSDLLDRCGYHQVTTW